MRFVMACLYWRLGARQRDAQCPWRKGASHLARWEVVLQSCLFHPLPERESDESRSTALYGAIMADYDPRSSRFCRKKHGLLRCAFDATEDGRKWETIVR